MEADAWIKKLKAEFASGGGRFGGKEKACASTDFDYALKVRAASGDEEARKELSDIAERYGLMESAKGKDAAAEYEMGKLCLDFLGKREEGVAWIKSAALHGSVDASVLLGEIYCGKSEYFSLGETELDFPAAFELLAGAAKKSGKACYYLAELYGCGNESMGVEKNDAKAYYWYRQAAGKAHKIFRAKAMAEIARYCKSQSVFRDLETAFKLYLALYEVGQSGAACELADCYLRGLGTEKDEEKGLKILLSAALSGNKRAEEMYEKLKNSP